MSSAKTRTKKAKVNIIKRNIESTKSKHKNLELNEFALPQQLTPVLALVPHTTTMLSDTLQIDKESNLHTLHKYGQPSS